MPSVGSAARRRSYRVVMLELKDVSRSSGRDPILARTSLNIAPEVPTAFLGLLAPQREALLRLLSGMDRPQTGSIRLNGQDVGRARSRIVRLSPGGVSPSGRRLRT